MVPRGGSGRNVTREIRIPAADFLPVEEDKVRRMREATNAARRQRRATKKEERAGARARSSGRPERREEDGRCDRAKFICIGPPSLFRAEIQLIGFPGITARVRGAGGLGGWAAGKRASERGNVHALFFGLFFRPGGKDVERGSEQKGR